MRVAPTAVYRKPSFQRARVPRLFKQLTPIRRPRRLDSPSVDTWILQPGPGYGCTYTSGASGFVGWCTRAKTVGGELGCVQQMRSQERVRRRPGVNGKHPYVRIERLSGSFGCMRGLSTVRPGRRYWTCVLEGRAFGFAAAIGRFKTGFCAPLVAKKNVNRLPSRDQMAEKVLSRSSQARGRASRET